MTTQCLTFRLHRRFGMSLRQQNMNAQRLCLAQDCQAKTIVGSCTTSLASHISSRAADHSLANSEGSCAVVVGCLGPLRSSTGCVAEPEGREPWWVDVADEVIYPLRRDRGQPQLPTDRPGYILTASTVEGHFCALRQRHPPLSPRRWLCLVQRLTQCCSGSPPLVRHVLERAPT